MRHLIYKEADHFRKLKIKEWLFLLTDEREDPEEEAAEEETAEVAQKKKRKRKDKRTTASREKKKKKRKWQKSLVINNFSYIKDKVIIKPRSKTGMIPGYFLNMWKQRYKIYYFYSYF